MEQKRLTGIYRDITDCIPVLLEDHEGLKVSEIYAPLLIEEDLDAMKRTRRPDEPGGSKTLKSVRNVFCSMFMMEMVVRNYQHAFS